MRVIHFCTALIFLSICCSARFSEMTPADFTVLTQAYCFVNFMSVSILLHVLEAPLGKQIKPPWIRLYLILSSTCNLYLITCPCNQCEWEYMYFLLLSQAFVYHRRPRGSEIFHLVELSVFDWYVILWLWPFRARSWNWILCIAKLNSMYILKLNKEFWCCGSLFFQHASPKNNKLPSRSYNFYFSCILTEKG